MASTNVRIENGLLNELKDMKDRKLDTLSDVVRFLKDYYDDSIG